MPEYLIELETSTLTIYRVKAANEAAAKKLIHVELTRAFMEAAFGPASESDDKGSRMEKYGVAFAAISYALERAPVAPQPEEIRNSTRRSSATAG